MPGASLTFGFELIERRVEERVALVDERVQRADDVRVRAGVMERRLEAAVELEVARDRPRVDQRHQELGVVHLEARELVDLPDLVADDEAEVPERVQDGAEQPLFGRAEVAAEEDEQIDVGVEAELLAAVPADRDDRDGRHRRGAGRFPGRVVEDLADEAVEAFGEPRQRRAAAVAEHDVVAQLAARLFQQHRQACRRRRVRFVERTRVHVRHGGVSLRSRGNPVPSITYTGLRLCPMRCALGLAAERVEESERERLLIALE